MRRRKQIKRTASARIPRSARIARRCAVVACVACLPLCSQSPRRSTLSRAQLVQGFRQPPPEAKLRCYWWWLNGNTDRQTIANDLREMRAKGFGGALLVDANGASQGGNDAVPAGPTFGSPRWIELYRFALAEADRLGLEITLNINSGWNLGGPVVKPEEASKLLTWSRTVVNDAHPPFPLMLPAPPAKNGFYRDIAVLAFPADNGAHELSRHDAQQLAEASASTEAGFSMPDADWMLRLHSAQPAPAHAIPVARVLNLTDRLQRDGTLRWDIPAGRWLILRIGYTDSGAKVSTSSGAWQGLALDHMSRRAFDSYWDRVVDPLLKAAAPFHSLRFLATDSWELGGTNWTEDFAREFEERRGYSPLPWLPVVAGDVIESSEASDRFLADLRRTVGDLIADNHYARFAERAAAYHLGVQAESGGPHGAPIDALQTFRRSAIPQTEFWSINGHRKTDDARFFTKEAASAANIYGQRIVAQEGETSIGPQWSESLVADLKPSFDMAVTEGMNRLVWHEFTSSPASTGMPGQEYFAGTHLNPKVTWWNAAPDFFLYLNRVQFLMQQGTPVNDVLYFYGDNVPAFVRLKADDPAHVLPGFDYDVTDEDALLHSLHIAGDTIVGPSGVRWRALALPRTGRLSLAALRFARDFVHSGGLVVGSRPSSPIGNVSASTQAQFNALADELWTGCAPEALHPVGRGAVFCGASARAALLKKGIAADVSLDDETAAAASFTSTFDYAHRRVGATDVYFVRNGAASASDHTVTFRVTTAHAEVWDPVTGSIERIATQRAAGGTQVRLHLPPFGSRFVVFTPAASSAPAAVQVVSDTVLEPSGGWTVSFQPGRGGPAQPLVLHDLVSWTDLGDSGARYFSGTATYTAHVEAPVHTAQVQVWLSFDDVREIARVRINGHDAGTVWARPLALRVDPWLRAGANTVEIAVTNLWPNRLIGDQQPGVTRPFTHTNIRAYTATSPLLPSGLIGRVHWQLRR